MPNIENVLMDADSLSAKNKDMRVHNHSAVIRKNPQLFREPFFALLKLRFSFCRSGSKVGLT